MGVRLSRGSEAAGIYGALSMVYWLVNCHAGSRWDTYCIGLYALSRADAFRRIREQGYTPTSVEYCGAMRLDS